MRIALLSTYTIIYRIPSDLILPTHVPARRPSCEGGQSIIEVMMRLLQPELADGFGWGERQHQRESARDQRGRCGRGPG